MTSIHETIGSLTLPVSLAPVQSERTLVSLDPARRILADLIKAAIEAEFTAAWQQATLGMNPDGPISPRTPVADVLELAPTGANIQERSTKFPLLAIYRSGEAEREEPVTFYSDSFRQPWTVDWVMGPADVATQYRFGDIAVAISKLIARVLDRQSHPAYRSGEIQFGPTRGNLQSIRWTGHQGPAQAQFADRQDGPTYYAITISLESTEEADPNPAGDGVSVPFEGADYDMGLGGAPEGVLPGAFYASTDPPFQGG